MHEIYLIYKKLNEDSSGNFWFLAGFGLCLLIMATCYVTLIGSVLWRIWVALSKL